MDITGIIGFHVRQARSRTRVRHFYYNTPEHRSDARNTLLFIEKGLLVVELDDRKFQAPEGHVILAEPSRFRKFRSLPPHFSSYKTISFDLRDINGDSPTLTQLGFPVLWKAGRPQILKGLLRKIIRLWALRGRHVLQECGALGLKLLTVMEQDALPAHRKSSEIYKDVDRRIDAILAFIHANFKRTFTVESLARKASLHPIYFSRLFRKATGLSPYRYILIMKIEKAKEIMVQFDDPPTSAALELGFTDYAHFYRTFKRMTGLSPGQYCRRYRPKRG